MGLFITVAVLIVGIKVWWIWFNAPQRVGARGERWVANALRNGLPPDYCVINDVYLPLPDGTTTQLDHIVVSRYGVFVIETKTYSGWIFGDAQSSQWTQTIYRKKSRFQNPLRQNFRHKCALADCLGIPRDYFKDIVVFNGDCHFKTEMPPEVMRRGALASYIKSFTVPILKDKEVEDIASAISEWATSVGDEQKKRHVSNLHARHAAVASGESAPLCPYCGVQMILRVNRKTGEKFYGCSGYPKCRGMRKVAD